MSSSGKNNPPKQFLDRDEIRQRFDRGRKKYERWAATHPRQMISLGEITEIFLRSDRRVILPLAKPINGLEVMLFVVSKGGRFSGYRLEDSWHGDFCFWTSGDTSEELERFLKGPGVRCEVVEPERIVMHCAHWLSRVIHDPPNLFSDPFATATDGIDFIGRDGRTLYLPSGTMTVSSEPPCFPNG